MHSRPTPKPPAGASQFDECSALVSRAVAGDAAAFDALVARYRPSVFKQALRKVGDPHDAEEVTQRVLIKAYTHLGDLRAASDFQRWLRAITANEAVSWSRGRHQHAELGEAEEGVRDASPTPEQALIEKETRLAVQGAVDSLPDQERQLVREYYIEGKSYPELQSQYGLPRGTLASHLHRARRKLAARLQNVLGGVAWVPSLDSWWQAVTSAFSGGQQMHAAKTAITTATVATVAVISALSPPPQPRVTASHRPSAASAHAPKVADRAAPIRPRPPSVEPDGAFVLGTPAAEAAEVPSSPSVERANDDEIIFREGDSTRRFVMRDGRLYVEEDGKSRPATSEETAQFNSIQERRRAIEERARRLSERAEAIRPNEEQIRRMAERMRQRAEAMRPSEEEIRRITEEARRLAESMRPREEELRRMADELRRRAEAMRPSEEQLRRLAEEARKLEPGPLGAKDAAAIAERAMRMAEAVKPNEEAIRRLTEQAAKMAQVAQPKPEELRRLMEQVRKITESAVGRGLGGDGKEMEGLQGDIQKMVDGIMSQIQPILGEVGPLSEDAKRLHEEMLKLNEKARSSSE